MKTIVLILAVLAFGCDQQSQASRRRTDLPKSIPGEGFVHGAVRFIGTPPVMKPITPNDACCQGEPLLYDETVVVNPNQTLRNVFVYLENAPATDGSAQPVQTIDQVHCTYTPHAVAVQAGQRVRVRSSDPTLHNVHYVPQANPANNFALTAVGAEKVIVFDYAEFVRLKCDVHPWMNAWVGVFENPFFAVTRETGEFEIRGIPPGTYTLVAWQELYGTQKKTVTIADGQPVEMDFVFGKQVAG